MKTIWRGKPSPRGYCVHRYPFEREVSRNALTFNLPLSRPRHSLRSSPGQSPKLRRFSDNGQPPPLLTVIAQAREAS